MAGKRFRFTANGLLVSSKTRSTAAANSSLLGYMAEHRTPNPPALEMAAVNSAVLIHIIVPPTMGYSMPNMSVIFVRNIV